MTLTEQPEAAETRERAGAPELLSQDRLEAQAVALAETHTITPDDTRGRPLLPRLEDSARALEESYAFLSAAVRLEAQSIGSEDWLRDNHHIVQDQVREIRQDLPRKYYLELPKLASGANEGYPRVYAIAQELIGRTAGRLDLQTLVGFVRAYQRVAPLSMGEVWAIAIMLRLTLLEELQRLAARVAAARHSRNHAQRWTGLLANDPDDPKGVMERLLQEEQQTNRRLSAAFVVELLQYLRDQPPSAAPAWQALHEALAAQGDLPENMLRVEHYREAADQLAIGNVITTMRLLSSIDWPLFFEQVSLVEEVLREDPAGAYARMDFATRDRYRHSVEQLSRRAKESELEVARQAVDLARHARQHAPEHDRTHHVGYYLISRGRFQLEARVRYPPTARERWTRFVFRHPAVGYLGTIGVLMALSIGSLLAYAHRHGASRLELVFIGLLIALPISELAISLLHLIVTSLVGPRPLPKLDLRQGISEADRTIVVVPAIIDSDARLASLLEDLEVRFFANRDPNLHFALLTDFADADRQTLPEDEALLALARQRVDALNQRHGVSRFLFFHRERRWNPGERRWMGWERKRGKLEEFNRLLRGAKDTSFVVEHGERHILKSIRYVITLDSDTQLPMEAGRRLVGTISHPLNRPRFDRRLQRVTEGYGILQPRVEVSSVSANRTTFAQVFSGHVGMDPYTTAVSDVYQDLFHEGSYVGKGIYDVESFEAALHDRVPENSLLSHDLFEGFYARAGLVTDIELIDNYPANYLAFSSRLHRWVRGDWQIVRWLWRTVPDARRQPVPNTLPAISRWKILDNLRRSLLQPSLLALLVASWTVLPGSAALWMAVALLVLAFPAYIQFARSLGSRVRGVPLREHMRAEAAAMVTGVRQATLSITLLAHQTVVMLDAIVRALFRILVSRRRLLEWVSADRFEHAPLTVRNLFQRMWPAPALAGVVFAIVAATAPGRLLQASPILLLWAVSPVLAYTTGLPRVRRRGVLSAAQRAVFRQAARRTWRFFDDLVGPADHWLAPDNYQENRSELIAHRTSPTNIGLQILSTVAAYDFGYLGITGVLDRLEPTFDTLLRLQRYRGHFYNWYDTQTLAPLAPTYISTVDSGNLAGYLLTLRTALVQMETAPIIDTRALDGLRDAADLLHGEIRELPATRAVSRLRQELAELREQLGYRPLALQEWRDLLALLAERLLSASAVLSELEESSSSSSSKTTVSPAFGEAAYWIEKAAISVAAWESELKLLTGWMAPRSVVPSLTEIVRLCDRALESESQRQEVHSARRHAVELMDRAARLGALADDFVEETEFGFLFNRDLHLFSIGFNVSEGRPDGSHYDMLASEARLASFLAIATGSVPHDHWFRLGRSLTQAGASRVLLSWSASMFEYLMPLLVMREYPSTLLGETYRAVVQRQIQYGAQRAKPWGISESAYNVQDLEGNYQYRAFGVPGLGLKRGLGDDLVVAPYASLLASGIEPIEVLSNLEALTDEGVLGPMGYYEAIDYTPERVPEGHKGGVVLPTYMAHHQGMSLLALDNLLNGSPMQARFHADPRIQAADVLLQERIPQLVPLRNPPAETAEHVPTLRRAGPPRARMYLTPHTLSPRTHLLSNGSYTVMVTNAGGGYSRCQSVALTRWREDMTRDCWGTFLYVRDVDTGETWSATYQPTRREPDEYDVTFAIDRAVWRRLDGQLETRTELVVSPEDDVELRRISITNHSSLTRSLDLTSYAEVVITPGDADLAHPAFSNLFVETRAVQAFDALICARRPRSGGERLHLIHVLSGRARIGTPTEYETNRTRFVGRGGTLEQPAAMSHAARLSNTTGAVLDPIVSLRQSLRLPPGGTARLSFVTGFANSEARAMQLIEKYHDRRAVARAFALASTHSQVELRHLGLTLDDTLRFQRLGGRLLSGDPRLRSHEAAAENRRSQSALWKYGISGDLPITLVRIADDTGVALFRQLLKAHEYLRHKGLQFDLVVLNEHGVSYLQDLQHALQGMLASSPEQAWADKPGGVFLRRSDLMEPEDQLLLRATARVVMDAAQGGLEQQLVRPQTPFRPHPAVVQPAVSPEALQLHAPDSFARVETLELFNGIGGFAENGREYHMRIGLGKGLVPPAPWSVVIAHPRFGFSATELGCGYTWSGNSHDNRLTPWTNDPVRDPQGEALFLRDEDTGTFWSATPLPAGGGLPFTVRHGYGYTIFEHLREEISSTLRLSIVPGEPVKVYQLRLRNSSSRRRRLSVTLYVEWTLGEHRSRTSLHIVTNREPATGALLAFNAFRNAFNDRVAFIDLFPGEDRTVTGDRTEFIGRNSSLRSPAALQRERLSDTVGATLDPCGAIRVHVALEPGEERSLAGLLGEAADAAGVSALVERYRNQKELDSAFDRMRQFWWSLLRTVQVKTPDRSLDLMLNGWLQYQTLACRIWGRSAFYQSSGAFGFRDQLQDVLAFLIGEPQLAREQLLRAAARQFVEGDVQHWWHEPSGQGVRTRFSDDRLWLVFGALEYLAATGDRAVLDEEVPFLEGRILNPDEQEAYELPAESRERGTLYEHCVRAVAISMETGPHGLPLMGAGDWNDGMNLVGAGGRGESVWLAWFLISILRPFADVAESRGETDRASTYRRHADALAAAAESAWDGEWYRRAYFDDGTPLGSRTNDECRIDAIAQSWAVISGAADPARAKQALASSLEHLVREDDRLIALLTPPFDRMSPSPGYIQGYVPGVRENGGQYTHAALWTIMALARIGDGDRAMQLFSMINPVNHARTPEEVLRYRVEPYVVAADVYSQPPHAGRGGWTWYTGSAGWMYRVGIESLLGLTRVGNRLKIDPCIPRTWPRYELTFRNHRSEYHIVVENPQSVSGGVVRMELDGAELPERILELADDGEVHRVRVVLGDDDGPGSRARGPGTGDE